MEPLMTFYQFINESKEDFDSEKALFDYMLSVGLISKEEYGKELRRSARLHGAGPAAVLSPEMAVAVNSPEAKALNAAGLYLVSTDIQHINGNLVWGPPDYDRKVSYAIGFFPEIRKVRRMTPKTPRQSPYGWMYSPNPPQDDTIKHFPMATSNADFYKIAMRWVLDHVDLENSRFPVKKRTARDYFSGR